MVSPEEPSTMVREPMGATRVAVIWYGRPMSLRGPEGDLRRTVTAMSLLCSSKRASVIVSPWPRVTRTVKCWSSGRRNPSIWVAASPLRVNQSVAPTTRPATTTRARKILLACPARTSHPFMSVSYDLHLAALARRVSVGDRLQRAGGLAPCAGLRPAQTWHVILESVVFAAYAPCCLRKATLGGESAEVPVRGPRTGSDAEVSRRPAGDGARPSAGR